MSHTSEEWTDRFGRDHVSCGECEEPWPCRESKVKPLGWLIPGFLDATAIIEAVAHGFGVNTDELIGVNRARHLTTARVCAMAVVRKQTGWSWQQMGTFFDLDHTTVMHHVAKVDGDPALGAAVAAVVAELRPTARLFAVPDAV